MSIFDTLRKKAETVAQVTAAAADTAVKQTKTMASIGRVKLAITTEEDKLKKAYTELGRLFYRDYKAQAEADMEEYLPWCAKADDCKAQIAKLTQELEKLKSAPETAEEAPAQAELADVEDASIFADFEESSQPELEIEIVTEEVPEVVIQEVPAQEPAAEEPATEASPEEAPAEETTETQDIPTVGTLYVDVTGQEE